MIKEEVAVRRAEWLPCLWAVRDDQAVTQETAETVPQKGKGAPDDGNGKGGTGN